MSDDTSRRPWWRRHWKKTLLLGSLALLLVGYGGLLLARHLALNLGDERGAYQQSLQRLRAAPVAERLLGTPVEIGSFVRGRVEGAGGTRRAQLAIPVSGPRASGTLHVRAERAGDAWAYERLELAVDDNSLHVSLLPGAARPEVTPDSLQIDRLYEGMMAPPDSN